MPWILSFFLLVRIVFANHFEENPILQDYFQAQNLKGTFIVYDSKRQFYTGYNLQEAKIAYSPASTFKIWNALIALHEGIVQDVDEVFYHYKDEKVFLPSWKSDASLRSAIKISQVPAFKQIAREIGRENMQKNLQKLHYGNEAIGTRLDSFWLDGTLRISALRQVELLHQLLTLQLDYPKNYQKEVLEIIKLEHNIDFTLYGKTGLFDKAQPMEGWFVGILQTNMESYPFALRIEIPKEDLQDLLERRIQIAKTSLAILFHFNYLVKEQ